MNDFFFRNESEAVIMLSYESHVFTCMCLNMMYMMYDG